MSYEQDMTTKDINLVKKIAAWAYKTYWSENMKDQVSRSDLYHTGIIGLMEAKKQIDPSKNPEAYKATRIRGTIIDFIRKQTLVRVPKDQWRQVKAVRATKTEITAEGGAATDKEIAQRLGWPIETVQKAAAVRLSVVPAGERTENNEDRPTGPVLTGTEPNPENALLRAELTTTIQNCLEAIKDRIERMILICRFQHGLELKILAKVMRFSIEGIRQKQLRAQSQMKDCLEAKGWAGADVL